MNDYFGYGGTVAVVTGAASGMGKATATMLVDLGADVYALDWAQVDVPGVKAAIHTDLSDKMSIDAAFAQIPDHIDSFFGIAGVSGSNCDFLTTTKIDLIANKYICEKILPDRMDAGGAIAFITSTGGVGWELDGNKQVYLPVVQADGWDDAVAAVEQSVLAHLPGTLGYPFSKMAMNYYVAQLQATYAARGIRVNAVLPGSTASGLSDEFAQMSGGEESLTKHNGYSNRLATPEEMSAPVVFLNSAMASDISGELMIVDYGYTIERTAGIVQEPPIVFSAIIEHIMKAAQGGA